MHKSTWDWVVSIWQHRGRLREQEECAELNGLEMEQIRAKAELMGSYQSVIPWSNLNQFHCSCILGQSMGVECPQSPEENRYRLNIHLLSYRNPANSDHSDWSHYNLTEEFEAIAWLLRRKGISINKMNNEYLETEENNENGDKVVHRMKNLQYMPIRLQSCEAQCIPTLLSYNLIETRAQMAMSTLPSTGKVMPKW